MDDARTAIFEWVASGRLAESQVPEALRLAEVTPNDHAWRQFIDRLLLGLGVVFVAAGTIFFVAANWQAMGRFARFGLVEAAIVAAIASCVWQGPDSRAGKAALVAAALFTGALLALVGQVYQTGADTFELFAAWGLAIAAWVAVARMPALWLLWLGIVNLAIALYLSIFPNFFGLLFFGRPYVLWALFAFDLFALVVWEMFSARGVVWLQARWAMRVLAFAAGAAMTALAVIYAAESGSTEAWTPLIYAGWLGAMYWAYRTRTTDLFMLAGCVLSIVLVVTALSLRLFDFGSPDGLLLTGLLVSAIAAGGARWLRRVAAQERSS